MIDADARAVPGQAGDCAELLHGLLGYPTGLVGAGVESFPDEVRMGFEALAFGLDGSDVLADGQAGELLAVLAGDRGCGAAEADVLIDVGFGEDAVEVTDGAEFGVAGIGLKGTLAEFAHAVGLFEHDGEAVGEQDGVAIALGHLAAVGAGEFGGRGQEDLGFGEKPCELPVFKCQRVALRSQRVLEIGFLFLFPVEQIEAAGDLAGNLDVGDLVSADRDEVGAVEEDVGGLEEGVAEEAEGGEVFLLELLLLILVGGDAFKPGERGNHAEEEVELGVLGDVRLDEDSGARGVEAGGEEVERDLEDILLESAGVGVVGSEGVPVGDEEEAVVYRLAVLVALVLEIDPVFEGTHVVAEVERAGGAHAGEDAGAGLMRGGVGHLGSRSMVNEWVPGRRDGVASEFEAGGLAT